MIKMSQKLELSKIIEKTKKEGVSDEQREKIFAYSKAVSKDTINEVCPALHRIVLKNAEGALKNQRI